MQPKLLTEAKWHEIIEAPASEIEKNLAFLRECGLIAEPVDPIHNLAANICKLLLGVASTARMVKEIEGMIREELPEPKPLTREMVRNAMELQGYSRSSSQHIHDLHAALVEQMK